MNIQSHDNPWRQIIAPSQASIVTGALIALGFAAATTFFLWAYSANIGEFLKIGIEQQTTQNSLALHQADQAVNNSEIAANISVFAFWFLIGGITYVAATTVWHSIRAATSDIEHVVLESYTGRYSTLLEVLARVALRLLGILLLIGAYFAAKIVFPLYLLWLYQLSSTQLALKDIVIALLSISCALAVTHIVVVGLRLTTLRVRLYTI